MKNEGYYHSAMIFYRSHRNIIFLIYTVYIDFIVNLAQLFTWELSPSEILLSLVYLRTGNSLAATGCLPYDQNRRALARVKYITGD